jgi:hypothetical protein
MQAFDDQTKDPEAARSKNLRELRRPLQRVPRAERGVEWTERVVIAYCIKRVRSARVRSLRKSIIRYWEERGNPEKANDFSDRVDCALDFSKPHAKNFFIQFAAQNTTKTANDLLKLISILQDEGQQVFINSGTLLGAVREESFIGHDDDIDLGLILTAEDERDVVQEFISVYRLLSARPELDIKTSFNSPVLKITFPSDVVVDLFPTWIKSDKVFVWPHTCGELNETDLLPLKKIKLSGIKFPAPAEPEKMLELNYGCSWTKPDADFAFPWREARHRFRNFLRSYWWAVRILALSKILTRR